MMMTIGKGYSLGEFRWSLVMIGVLVSKGQWWQISSCGWDEASVGFNRKGVVIGSTPAAQFGQLLCFAFESNEMGRAFARSSLPSRTCFLVFLTTNSFPF